MKFPDSPGEDWKPTTRRPDSPAAKPVGFWLLAVILLALALLVLVLALGLALALPVLIVIWVADLVTERLVPEDVKKKIGKEHKARRKSSVRQ